MNTTTAPTDLKRNQAWFTAKVPREVRPSLDVLVRRLEARRRVKPGRKDYHLLVYPYFGAMATVLREVLRVLRRGANLHLVVADSALYGVHIQTDLLLAETMKALGFAPVVAETLRQRGHRWILEKRDGPGRPLGEFHIRAGKP